MQRPNGVFSLGALLAGLFRMPDNSGKVYAPGWQPNSPGNSSTPGWNGGNYFNAVPWPNAVPSLNALANDPGVPRERAPIPVVDRYAFLPEQYQFITGFVGKSQG